MKSFEKLLDIVRKNNPNLISEQDAQTMLNDYNSYETQLQSDSFENGRAAGFEDGYREGMEKQKAVCKQELDELLNKCDEDATNKIEAIVKMLNDEHAAKLQEVYDYCMQTMTPNSEVEAMDADHAEKFNQAIDALNDDHCKKLECACNAVASKCNEEIEKKFEEMNDEFKQKIAADENEIEQLKKDLDNEKSQKMSFLTEAVDKYLNYAIHNSIPAKNLVSEAKYNASQKAIEKITSILKINSILQESKDGIFQDYENKLAESKAEKDKLIGENADLKNKLEKEEAKVLLESKIAKCTPAEAEFLRNYFNNAKNSRVIEEQIEDAMASYKRLHDEKRKAIVDKNAKTVTSKASNLVNESAKTKPVEKKESTKTTITESKTTSNNSMNPFIAAYSQMLKNQ